MSAAAHNQQASTDGPWDGPLFLDLRPSRRSSRCLPVALQRLLPNPLIEDGHQRYWHLDLSDLSDVELRRELERIVVCVALAEDDRVPAWLEERRTRLKDEIEWRRSNGVTA